MFAAVVGEFGSALGSTDETGCMSSILAYANGADATSPANHARIDSFFYWCAPGHGPAGARGGMACTIQRCRRQDSMRACGLPLRVGATARQPLRGYHCLCHGHGRAPEGFA